MSEAPFLEEKLTLTLFGGPKLFRGSERIPLSPFQGALLGLVAGHRGGLSRSACLVYFWRAGRDSDLRRRLSQLIYSLNKRSEGAVVLVAQAGSLALNGARVDCDLDDLVHLIRKRRASRAARMISRGFLTDLRGFPTPDLERWVRSRHLRFRADVRKLSAECWADAEASARWEAGLEAAEALLLLDPSDEAALQRCLQAQALLGRADAARSTFLQFQERSRERDPKWRADPSTLELVERLRAPAEIERSDSDGESVSLQLVGREKELSHLLRVLKRPQEGKLSFATVWGEPGIGKTRLAEELVSIAPFHGLRTLSGRCSEFEQGIPLAPLLDLLKPAWITQAVDGLSPPWRGVLLAELPEFDREDNTGRPVPTIQPGEVPRRLCEAFRLLFENLASNQPLLVFLDDVHWADETTLSVLEYLRRRWENGRMVLLTTARNPLHDGRASCGQRWTQGLGPSATNIVLGELGRAGAKELLELARGEPVSDIDLEQALQDAGGVPLLLLSSAADTSRRSGPPLCRPGPVPVPSLRTALSAWLAGVSPEQRRLLEILAVSTRPLTATAGSDIAQIDEEEWWNSLQPLDDRLLLRWSPRGVAIRHDLVRSHILSIVPEARWRQLNQRIGKYIAGLPDPPPGELAFHAYHGEGGEAGIGAAVAASIQAEETGAYSESITFSKLAVDLSGSDAERTRAIVEHGIRLFRFGRIREAQESLHEAAACAQAKGDEEQATACDLALLSCGLQLGEQDVPTALVSLDGLIRKATAAGWWPVLADAFELSLKLRDANEDLSGVRQTLKKVKDTLSWVHTTEGKVRFKALLALDCFFGDPTLGLASGREAASLSTSGECSEAVRLQALNRLLVCFIARGILHGPEGRDVLEASQKLAERSGDLLLRCYPVANQSAWSLDIGDPSGALTGLSRILPFFDRHSAPEGQLRVRGNRGLAFLQMDRFEEALKEFTQAERLFTPLTAHHLRRQIHAGLGLALFQLGRLDAARERRDRLMPLPSSWAADPTGVIRFLSMWELRNQRPDKAVQLARDAADDIKDRFPLHWLDLVILQGRVLRRSGQPAPQSEISEALALAQDRRLLLKKSELLRLAQAR